MKKPDLLNIDYVIGGIILVGYARKRKGPGSNKFFGKRVVKSMACLRPQKYWPLMYFNSMHDAADKRMALCIRKLEGKND
jgi:hypothetical protein|nr:MAG TPA: hypothetical protein [Caudoviricetes sp.]